MKNTGNYNVKIIAANIRAIRERLYYSQEYIALKLQVSQNTYSKIELGYVRLTLERFFDICSVLEVDPAEVINPGRSVAA